MQIKNYGQTPAKDVISKHSEWTVFPYHPPIGTIPRIGPRPDGEKSTSIIAPGEHVSVNTKLDDVDEDVARTLLAADGHFHCSIHGWYRDIYGQDQTVEGCFFFRSANLLDAIRKGDREVKLGGFTRANQGNEIS